MRGRRKAVDIVVTEEVHEADPDVVSASTIEGSTPAAPTSGSGDGFRLHTQPGTGGVLTVTPREASSLAAGQVRIGDMMVARGLITSQQLDYALAERVNTGQRLGSELVRLGMITERQLMETLAEQLHVPVADLRMTTPDPDGGRAASRRSWPVGWRPCRCA